MRRHAAWAYGAVAVVAVAMRLPNVWRAALSQDEVFSARILREPTLTGAVRHVIRTESTPPLWYSLGWLVHHLGVPVEDVRLLSVAFGGLLAVVVYALASELLPRGYAFVAALLVAVSYEPVAQGSELRAYALLALLAAVLGLLLLRALRSPSPKLDVAVGVTVWAGVLTHYFFVFSVAAVVAWLWLDPQARALRRRMTFAIAAAAVAAAPWLPGFLAQFRHDHYWWIKRFSWRVVLDTPMRVFAPISVRYLPVVVGVLVIVAVGAWLLARSGAAGRLTVALAFAPILLASIAWAGGLRIYAVRNLAETSPFVVIAATSALGALRRVAVPAAVAAVVATAASCVSVIALPPPQYQAVAKALVAAGWRPSDPIAVFGSFFRFRAPLEWYLPHAPRLDVSQPTGARCRAVFVVSPDENGDFDVTRLDRVSPRIRHATLLAAMGSRQRCVQLSRNPRLRPLS
ncbi:MAG TPA: glycosyltransferase family 39 protein [Gaiellaceae bacterium]|nr:glycosyltransferase family 39 protein [Gaiellaceae bacterium]